MQTVISGASGRVGRRLIASITSSTHFSLAAAVVSRQSQYLGQDSGLVADGNANGVLFSTEFPAEADAVIDFSTPEGFDRAADYCIANNVPTVFATTGLAPSQIARLQSIAESVPIIYAANTSLAVNLALQLADSAAKTLSRVGADVDVEIIERHHRFKEDSPSGTALKFGELVGNALSIDTAAHGREGRLGARPRNEIGYHAVRVGDDVGQHTVIFGMLGELLEIRVAASSRDAYAQGALAAAKFLQAQSPGLYSMTDVMGLAQ